MKKKTILMLIIILSIIYTSCSKKKICNSCSKEPTGHTIITLKTGRDTIRFETDFWLINNSTKQFSIASAGINNELYTFLYNNIKIISSNNIYSIVIYVDKLVENGTSFNIKNIKGLSVYEIHNKSIFHHLYIKENNIYNEVKKTNVEVPGVTSNHLNFYLKNYVFNDFNLKSYIIIFTNNGEAFYNNNSIPNVKIKKIKSSTTYKEQGGGESCGDPCTYGNNYFYCMISPYGSDCYPNGGPNDPCTANAVSYRLVGLPEQTILDYDLMYSFKSSFMENYQIGNEYIEYYNVISSTVYNDISLSVAMQTANTFSDFKVVLVKLLNYSNYYNDILINDELKGKLINLILQYKSLNSNQEFQTILDSIIIDIQNYSNKTVQDVLNSIS
ncbi:MAG: hypothetical protein J7J86_01940 [Bacteroidales bacterium]|nr:hypothetical protein [Bacteroidales bacterium]